MIARALLACAACCFAVCGAAFAAALPQTLAPPQPFPQILTDAPTFSFVAPGVEYGDYVLWTAQGPLRVHAVSVDLRDPSVRVGTALADERLISNGETVSSMAERTGAVAGINGDYFDIGQTDQPLNVLVENGSLVRAPMKRYALAVTAGKRVEFAEFSLAASVQLPGGATVALDGFNAWPPPENGVAFLTPAFGPVAPVPNLTLVRLESVASQGETRTLRVVETADNTIEQPPGYYLGIGLNAYGSVPVPNPGQTLIADTLLSPDGARIAAALGGGPLLVRDGAPYDDPDGPSGGAFETLIPCSGAAVTADGRLLLLEVDGRQPTRSVGLTRAQFAALMLAFGATQGMALDGGGSSTLVTRRLGDAVATERNSPSDGSERPVADSLLVYSDAPSGPPALIAAHPQAVRALPGARVPLDLRLTDAAGHPVDAPGRWQIRVLPAGLGRIEGTTFVASANAAEGRLQIRRGDLSAQIPVHLYAAPARLEIVPQESNLTAGERVTFSALAYSPRGYPIALGSALHWSTTAGTIRQDGEFIAPARDATLTLRVGNAQAHAALTVGRHEEPMQVGALLHFASAPGGGPGSMELGSPCARCVTLNYDFTGDERAAYLAGTVPLPAQTLGVAFDVLGDGNGEVLRVALDDHTGERLLLTGARVTWTGWRRVSVALPASAARPAALHAIYVVREFGAPAVRVAGAIAVRDVRAIVAGSAPTSRK